MMHHEDMKAQMTAHKVALETAQETAEQQLKIQMREAEEKFRQQQGSSSCVCWGGREGRGSMYVCQCVGGLELVCVCVCVCVCV